ncbi:hypothetical protein BpHYR1_005056 [Brachionus plicatilis]|uniref:Uncharacterized protein n=1 Tax=Brachionus plicatilis TaxID=10195 RepID=A0A3M7T6M4_BRAPC|nr:hypothetical protein BpHYR1_005056 [Brachionus plicatilis]
MSIMMNKIKNIENIEKYIEKESYMIHNFGYTTDNVTSFCPDPTQNSQINYVHLKSIQRGQVMFYIYNGLHKQKLINRYFLLIRLRQIIKFALLFETVGVDAKKFILIFTTFIEIYNKRDSILY